jgi:hypothetical protein
MSSRSSAPWFGMERKEKGTDIAVAMASIFDAAIRPKQGCDARVGLVPLLPIILLL